MPRQIQGFIHIVAMLGRCRVVDTYAPCFFRFGFCLHLHDDTLHVSLPVVRSLLHYISSNELGDYYRIVFICLHLQNMFWNAH